MAALGGWGRWKVGQTASHASNGWIPRARNVPRTAAACCRSPHPCCFWPWRGKAAANASSPCICKPEHSLGASLSREHDRSGMGASRSPQSPQPSTQESEQGQQHNSNLSAPVLHSRAASAVSGAISGSLISACVQVRIARPRELNGRAPAAFSMAAVSPACEEHAALHVRGAALALPRQPLDVIRTKMQGDLLQGVRR